MIRNLIIVFIFQEEVFILIADEEYFIIVIKLPQRSFFIMFLRGSADSLCL